ncbi:MAG: hypothetical protein K9N05_05395 [Candidatus Marinimicrobia bacterium]|nr:hypothetical protein [Candidatus Neomarinimicrobiota bacterium]
MTKNSNNITQQQEFLDIPYNEHIVPFPNFASVLMQHAREFPDKIALQLEEKSYTYFDLLNICLSYKLNKDNDYKIKIVNIEKEVVFLLALLTRGIPFELKFMEPGTYVSEDQIGKYKIIDYFDPPYVRLDDKAFVLNGEYEFSQYNIMVAAQAVGNAFKLFREGAAYCFPEMFSIADLVFGVLAPLYYAKSIYFIEIKEPNFFQYAWNGVIKSELRDAVMVTNEVNYHENAFILMESFDQALGLGPLKSIKRNIPELLGVEISNENGICRISGHCMGKKLNSNE